MTKKLFAVLTAACMLVPLAGILPGYSASAPDAKPVRISNWAAHNYTAADGGSVVSELTPRADGGIQVTGDQVYEGKGVGVTHTKPVYLDKGGFSVRFSLDQFDASSQDKWFALSLMDQKTVVNGENPDPVYKQWDNTGANDPGEGRGWVLIMRPGANGRLTFQHFYVNVASKTDASPANTGYVYVGDGCYDNIRLKSGDFKDVKVDFVKREDGGYRVVFNEGQFDRVDGSGNAMERIDGAGEMNPHNKIELVDGIFGTGTPAYFKMVAYNAAAFETKFTVKQMNGEYANLANTPESFGLHNYTTPGGSVLENQMEADETGNLIVSGNQAAGEGELGVTYARPIDMAYGFSVDFSLDKYVTHQVSGSDSWISLQIKDKATVTDSANPEPVYQKMDAGRGLPQYGSGLMMLMRPLGGNQLGIGEIFWNGVKLTPELSLEQAWTSAADGCYSAIQLDSFKHIKIEFVPKGAGYLIRVNDGNFARVGGDRLEGDGGSINPHNGFGGLRTLFSFDRPAYFSLVYHHNTDGAQAQFTVHSVNGRQAAPNKAESYGAHNYACISGPVVSTESAPDGKGGISFSGYQTAGDGGIGATWLRPVDLAEGLSVEFGLDNYRIHEGGPKDSFFAVQLMDKALITDGNNPDGAYRRFETNGGGKPEYGSGLVILIRPLANNVLGFSEIYWHGVKFNPLRKEAAFDHDANGCYAYVKVESFSRIKLAFEPTGAGSFDLIVNDGEFIRMANTETQDTRFADDHGKINVANGYQGLSQLFSNHQPAYLGLVYKDETGVPAQFTVHQINGIDAAPAVTEGENQLVDGVYDLIRDTKFEKGFRVTGMDSLTEGSQTPYYFNYGNNSLLPAWSLAQWDSKHDFRDEDATLFYSPDDNVYVYENDSKTVTVNTETGELALKLLASQVFSAPRTSGERWPHLLISPEGMMSGSEQKDAYRMKNVNQLRLQMDQKLTYFRDHMGSGANSGLHAAHIFLYLYVKGTNEQGKTEMMWFGIPLFDNRNPYPGEVGLQDGGKDDASGLFIYNVPSRAFTSTTFHQNGKPVGSEDSDWMHLDLDVLPFIQRALILANQKGFMKGVTMDSVFIDGMNYGWEMPGTYDAEMAMKNLSLKAYVGTSYESSGGIANLLVRDMEETEEIQADENLALTIPKNILEIDDFENAMLTVQAVRRGTAGGTGLKGDVQAIYDAGIYVNGNRYNYAQDNPLTLTYTLTDALLAKAGGNPADVKFYALFDDGTSREMTGVYSAASKSFTFTLDRLSNFAVVLPASEGGNNGDGDGSGGSSGGGSGGSGNPSTGDGMLSVLALAAGGAAAVMMGTRGKSRKKRK